MTPEEEEEAFRKDKAIPLKRAIPAGISMCLVLIACNYNKFGWTLCVVSLLVGAGMGMAAYRGSLYGNKS